MKKLSLLLLLSVFVFCGCSSDNENERKETVVSFEGKLTTVESEYIGYETKPSAGDWSSYPSPFKDANNLIEANHYYAAWGFAGGFTYINKTDKTTQGYTNISAITGKGKSGNTYLTSFTNSWTPGQITILNPVLYNYKGAWVTNSTYAYYSMTEGDNFGAKIFAKNDWYKLTATGYNLNGNETGKAEIFLANYKSDNDKPIADWIWFDMTPLNDASKVTFSLSSSDFNENGMLTPAYFCMDGITLIQK